MCVVGDKERLELGRVVDKIGLSLASLKAKFASLICPCYASTSPHGSSIKVESVQPSKCYFNAPPMAPTTPMAPPQASEEQAAGNSLVIKVDDGLNLPLKSNLKKPCLPEKLRSPKGEHTGEEHGTTNSNERRKVQWTDAHGQDLIQIKEFESRVSCGSEDDDDQHANRACACVIQ